jgi:deoxycytidylate deaminase
VIVDKTERIIATGYNGFAAGVESITCSGNCPRAGFGGEPKPGYDDCITIHAEANALMFCDRRDRLEGSLYVTSAVCISCAKMIANSGLAFVMMLVDWERDMHRRPSEGISIMESAGLTVDVR